MFIYSLFAKCLRYERVGRLEGERGKTIHFPDDEHHSQRHRLPLLAYWQIQIGSTFQFVSLDRCTLPHHSTYNLSNRKDQSSACLCILFRPKPQPRRALDLAARFPRTCISPVPQGSLASTPVGEVEDILHNCHHKLVTATFIVAIIIIYRIFHKGGGK